MKNVKISELKNSLSAILAKLSSLGSITVYDRNTPVAVIYPFGNEATVDEEEKWLRALEKKGILQSRNKPIPKSFFDSSPIKLDKKLDAVQILIDERGDR